MIEQDIILEEKPYQPPTQCIYTLIPTSTNEHVYLSLTTACGVDRTLRTLQQVRGTYKVILL